MENASKALIIAGAILLSILIISLGIMIFGQASGVIDNNSMTELEITSFNQKFTQYCGDSVRGANVKALLDAICANNRAVQDDSKKINVGGNAGFKIENGGTTYTGGTPKNGVVYEVKEATYSTGGLINSININNK